MQHILEDFPISAIIDERNMANSHYREARVDTTDKGLVPPGKLIIVLKHGLLRVHDMCCTAVCNPNTRILDDLVVTSSL
jgi:hypothetical protein